MEHWFQNTRGLVIIVLAVITGAVLLAIEPGNGFPTGATSSSGGGDTTVTTTVTTVPQVTTTTLAARPTLQEGSTDTANTTVLQQRLAALGFTVTVDGSFGPGTTTAVKQFQTAKGLPSTGIVDAATWNALLANPSSSTGATTTTSTTKP